MCQAKYEHDHGTASEMILACRPCIDMRNHDVIESAKEAKEANEDETDSDGGQLTQSTNEEKNDDTIRDTTTQTVATPPDPGTIMRGVRK